MKKNIVDFPDQERIAEEAAAWLIRLDGDEPLSAVERRRLGEWMSQSRRHREELDELARQWNALNVLTELSVPLDQPRSGASGVFRFAAVAAVVAAVGIALGALLWTRFEPTPASPPHGLYATAVGQQRTTTLVDGSVVALNTNTQIEIDYDEAFRDIRLLQGEAHFTVARDIARPFRVYAGDERIEATGTAFLVYMKDDGIDVAVTEGSVALKSMTRGDPAEAATRPRRNPAPGGTVDLERDRYDQVLGTLEAGQLATIRSTVDRRAERVSTLDEVRQLRAEDMARRLSWRSGVLMFTGETLSQVVREISRYTTVSIEIADPEVGEIRIGGRFPVGGETEEMFAALETNFGLEVTRLDASHVVVSARDD